jgi:hypothetical protein
MQSSEGQRTKEMVFAIQCPNPKCRKFLLVEERERGKIVTCLLCKEPIQVGGKPGQAPQASDAGTPARS